MISRNFALGWGALVIFGAVLSWKAVHKQDVEVFQAPEPSLAKSCLPVSEGLNTYQPSEVENTDFCAPEGAPIQSVTISNVDAWEFSQPWREKGTVSTMRDRLAFARKTAKPTATQLTIQTAQGVYLVVIAAEPARSAQP